MDELLGRAKAVFPGKVTTTKINDSGWSNVVIEINENSIVRFVRGGTKNDIAWQQFQRECRFLRAFSASFQLDIPNITKFGEDYIIYPKIAGEKFAVQPFNQLVAAEQTAIAQQLGGFLTQLHQCDPKHLKLVQYPYGDNDFWALVWPKVADRMQQGSADKLADFLRQQQQIFAGIDLPKVTVHGDLATNNLLANFAQGHISGVIDFSDVCINDPIVDFAGFFRHFGLPFVEQIFEYYSLDIGDFWYERLLFESYRKPCFVIYYAEKFGFESSIPVLIEHLETRVKLEL